MDISFLRQDRPNHILGKSHLLGDIPERLHICDECDDVVGVGKGKELLILIPSDTPLYFHDLLVTDSSDLLGKLLDILNSRKYYMIHSYNIMFCSEA